MSSNNFNPFDPAQLAAYSQQQVSNANPAPANPSADTIAGMGSQLPSVAPGAPPQPSAKGGPVKKYLMEFLEGFGTNILHNVGVPTPYERQALTTLNNQRQADTEESLARAKFITPAPINDGLADLFKIPRGTQLAPADLQHLWTVYGQNGGKLDLQDLKNRFGIDLQGLKNQGAANVAGINQGIQVPLPANIAQKYGVPDLAGKLVGSKTLNLLETGMGKNLKIIQRTLPSGEVQQYVHNIATGEDVEDLGTPGQIGINKARAAAFATAKSEHTPFPSFDENGNLVTISQSQAISSGVPSAQAFNTLYGPTGSTKTQGQAAQAVAEHIPDFQQAVKNLEAKGQLGAVEGRINEFLNRGYGGNDADIAEFVTMLGLIKSGAVRAHFGARGGIQILDKFDNMLNTAQNADVLIGSSRILDSFLKGYGNAAKLKGPHTVIPAPGNVPATPAKPTGFNYKTFPIAK